MVRTIARVLVYEYSSYQCSLASRSFSTTIVVNGGDNGMELMAPFIVIDRSDVGHCQLQWQSIAATTMAVFVDDGCH